MAAAHRGGGTHLLRAMLDAELKNACFGFIVDPEVAQQAHEAGVGSNIDVSLGSKHDDLHGEPLLLSVYVKALHDGRCIMQAMAKGSRIHYGKIARLQVGDMDIVVASHRRSRSLLAQPEFGGDFRTSQPINRLFHRNVPAKIETLE